MDNDNIKIENEQKLQNAEQDITKQIKAVITCDEDYSMMATLCQKVKNQINIVKDTFKDMKENAFNTHREICKKEKSFLEPLEKIETEIKTRMSDYLIMLSEKAKEIEQQTDNSMDALADIDDDFAVIAGSFKPTVSNKLVSSNIASSQDDFEVEITNPLLVPSYVNNVEIRTINTGAIKKLAKLTNGNISINGVKIIRKKQIRIRSEK